MPEHATSCTSCDVIQRYCIRLKKVGVSSYLSFNRNCIDNACFSNQRSIYVLPAKIIMSSHFVERPFTPCGPCLCEEPQPNLDVITNQPTPYKNYAYYVLASSYSSIIVKAESQEIKNLLPVHTYLRMI
jgi:hypothetical protein